MSLPTSAAQGPLHPDGSRIDYDRIADLYDLYVRADFDVPFFLREAEKVRGKVLELMAGTGRLSLPLLEAGVDLTCVDASRAMLDVLERKLGQRGLKADVRHASVCAMGLPAEFELAILPFHSFSELVTPEDQRACLREVAACLVPGGQFICTLHNPAIRAASVDGSLRLTGRFPTPDGTLIISAFETGGRPVVQRQQFFESYDNDGRLLSKRLLEMTFALLDRETFEGLAREAGFAVERLQGEYEGAEFDPAGSPFMIWVLVKKDDV
jgi:SAM-dependent methyltransferase